jgi:hypothetical protein
MPYVLFAGAKMPRTLKDAKLDSRSARLRLAARREPYWRSISDRMAVGYRRGVKGGTWVGRHYTSDHGRRFQALGTADDILDADGVHVLSFAQAQELARRWFLDIAMERLPTAAPITVKVAVERYVRFLKAERRTGLDTEQRLGRLVLPQLGERGVLDLSKNDIDEWKQGLIRRDPGDPEVERRSKDTANRVLSMFKAALNRAFDDPKNGIGSDLAWRRVKPFTDVGRAREAHLDRAEAQRLINSCENAFRNLVTAALLTGARAPHELASLRVRDFRADLAVLAIRDGKTGPRDVVLTREAVTFFAALAGGKKADGLLLPRDDGRPWRRGHQQRPMRIAVARAELPADTTIYALRHTYASQSILAGMNLKLLADNMGTSIRMLEQHYSKFIAAARRRLVEESAFKIGLPAPADSGASLATG